MRRITVLIGAVVLLASCNSGRTNAALEAQQKTIDELKTEIAKQRIIDSMSRVHELAATKPDEEKPIVVKRVVRSTPKTVAASNSDGYAGYSNNPAPVVQPTYNEPAPVYQDPVPQPQQQKKGWSAKAKGGTIGAGVGAVAGAIIHKRQPAVGAVVGGILGAGAGVGVGAVIDKKQGR